MKATYSPVSANDTLVLDMLTEAARTGAPCPKNHEINEVLFGHCEMASKAIARLASKGLIMVERRNIVYRRITIVETGQITGWSDPATGTVKPQRPAAPKSVIEARITPRVIVLPSPDALTIQQALTIVPGARQLAADRFQIGDARNAINSRDLKVAAVAWLTATAA